MEMGNGKQGGIMKLIEQTNSQKRVFTGRLIHVRHDEVTLPDGTETIREVVEHPAAWRSQR